MAPKGRPTTSTERMRLKKLRDSGEAPPVKTCSVCGKKLKQGAGSNRAWEAGLCWDHWKQTDEGRVTRRRQGLAKREGVWGVAFFGGEDLRPYTNMRGALSASVQKGGRDNHPVFVVWNTGIVTCHSGLTARKSVGLQPEDGDQLIDEYEYFLDVVPEHLKTWFDN